jgi:ceramide glucosyltransferase
MDVLTEVLAYLLAAFAAIAFFAHFATTFSAARRLRVPSVPPADLDRGPPVTIIRPVCGVDPTDELTLRSTFGVACREYEILFCCASAEDPACGLVRRLIAEYPAVRARLLIGDEHVSQNPKLNNVAKGWRAASHEWIVIADSNVLMPPDYIGRLMAEWCPDTGLVSAPPIGWQPQGLWSELECAYLNTYQARWQYAADSLGAGFAQGKNMLWRRSDLEAAGGIWALASELAEDAAATKVVRGLGLTVRLVDGAFPQPLGARTAAQVWSRQLRWARLRRSTFPGFFALEITSGLAAPLASLFLAGQVLDFEAMPLAAAYVAAWFSAEAWLAASLDWPLTWRSPLTWVLREVLLPLLWLRAWSGNTLSWRGNDITVPREQSWMARS